MGLESISMLKKGVLSFVEEPYLSELKKEYMNIAKNLPISPL